MYKSVMKVKINYYFIFNMNEEHVKVFALEIYFVSSTPVKRVAGPLLLSRKACRGIRRDGINKGK